MLYEVITTKDDITKSIHLAGLRLKKSTHVNRKCFSWAQLGLNQRPRITSYNVCYTKLLRAHEQIIGEQQLNAAFDKLLNHRNQLIEDFMFKEMQVDSSSIEIQTADLINLPEELKTTNYKVEVSVK